MAARQHPRSASTAPRLSPPCRPTPISKRVSRSAGTAPFRAGAGTGERRPASRFPAELAETRAFRTEQGYFLAARLRWELLGDVKKSGKFGFTIVINDSDSATHRTAYFLTPGLHDKKYATQYIQALLDTGSPGVLAKLPSTPSAQILEGRLLLSRAPEDAVLTAELSDAAGKKFQRSIADIRGVKPGELVLARFR